MRNILDEKPTLDLYGWPAFASSLLPPGDLEGRAILDIGCGFGWFELLALERGARSITGIEPTENDLATAKKHIDDDRVDWLVASALELPFANGSFDTVVCWEVLEHLPSGTEPQAFSEAARVLRPGGAFYLSTPNADLRSRLTDPAWWLSRHRHYSARHLRELAADASLGIDLLRTAGAWWNVLAINDLYVAKWIFRRRPFFERAIGGRAERELSSPGGFGNIFLRARKPIAERL